VRTRQTDTRAYLRPGTLSLFYRKSDRNAGVRYRHLPDFLKEVEAWIIINYQVRLAISTVQGIYLSPTVLKICRSPISDSRFRTMDQ